MLERMVLVPAGEFLMGDSLVPTHVDAFQIAVYPVTNRSYAEFLAASGRTPPQHWEGTELPAGKDDHPVVNISWHDALAYARFKGLSLPTEAQWEKAARGPDGRRYPWGDSFDPKKCNCSSTGIGDTTPVDHFPDVQTVYGALDMAGNVWEWADSDFLPGHRARCGGSHLNYGITDCRCAARTYFPEDRGSLYGGFRCVRQVPR